ncbi:MAG: META domain-containing protein [Acidimicrobiia bacterium]
MTVAELVGTWLPVSVWDYDGPLTHPPLGFAPHVSFNGKGEWSGSDGCNDVSGSYRLGRGGAFQLVEHSSTTVVCLATPAIPETAVRIELLHGLLTFLAHDGTQLAQYGRPGTRVADSRCTPSQLSATFDFVNHDYYRLGEIVLVNHGVSPCTLSGGPVVRLLGRRPVCHPRLPCEVRSDQDLVTPAQPTPLYPRPGNISLPRPQQPITLAANQAQAQGGVLVQWDNWCAPTPVFTLHVQFAGWETSLVATPLPKSTTPPPCTDIRNQGGLLVDFVRQHDATA